MRKMRAFVGVSSLLSFFLLSLSLSLSASAASFLPQDKFRQETRNRLECVSVGSFEDSLNLFASSLFYSTDLRSKNVDGWAMAVVMASGDYPLVFGVRPKTMAVLHNVSDTRRSIMAVSFSESALRMEEIIKRNFGQVSAETLETPTMKMGLFPYTNSIRVVKAKDGRAALIGELLPSFSARGERSVVACVNAKQLVSLIPELRQKSFGK